MVHIDLIDETKQLLKSHKQLLKDILKHTLAREGITYETELSLVITSNEVIKQLNFNYRNKDEATDVLSFPLVTAKEMEEYDEPYPLALGDLVISIEKVNEQAAKYNHSFERELAFLAVHGLLHLLGYTHDTKEKEKTMFEKQEKMLKEFQLER